MLKVYMDESGIHDGSPVCIVAAYLARPKDWKNWTKRWNAAKRPIKVYHAADSSNLKGEFSDWSGKDQIEFSKKLLPVLGNSNIRGLVIGINIIELEKALKGREELRDFIGTPYATCVQWVVQMILIYSHMAGSRERIRFYSRKQSLQERRHGWI